MESSAAPPQSPSLGRIAEPGQPLTCGGCGFDLRYASDRCPECGRAFRRDWLIDQLIPWEQRKYIGRVRAYLRTWGLAVFHPRKLADFFDRPVSLPDARAFGRVTAALVFVPLLINAILLSIAFGSHLGWNAAWGTELGRFFQDPASFGVAMAGMLAGSYVAAWITGWSFHRHRQPMPGRSRAVAVGFYTMARFMWLSLIAPPVYVGYSIRFAIASSPNTFNSLLDHTADVLVVLVAAGLVYTRLRNDGYVLRKVTECGWTRVLVMIVLLPAAWIVLPFVMVFVFEWIGLFLVVMFHSLS